MLLGYRGPSHCAPKVTVSQLQEQNFIPAPAPTSSHSSSSGWDGGEIAETDCYNGTEGQPTGLKDLLSPKVQKEKGAHEVKVL